jgi:hypothetical protein
VHTSPVRQEGHVRQGVVQTCNLTYCPTVTFVTIAAASLSAQRPLPVVVRFVRALRTTCSRGSGPPVDQRGQVFTSNQAWTAGIRPRQSTIHCINVNSRPDCMKAPAEPDGAPQSRRPL